MWQSFECEGEPDIFLTYFWKIWSSNPSLLLLVDHLAKLLKHGKLVSQNSKSNSKGNQVQPYSQVRRPRWHQTEQMPRPPFLKRYQSWRHFSANIFNNLNWFWFILHTPPRGSSYNRHLFSNRMKIVPKTVIYVDIVSDQDQPALLKDFCRSSEILPLLLFRFHPYPCSWTPGLPFCQKSLNISRFSETFSRGVSSPMNSPKESRPS